MHFNPYDPALRDDPYPAYRRLRDEFPVHFNEELCFYTLSRFADVQAAVQDRERLISSKGVTLLRQPERVTSLPLLITLDGAQHTEIRKVVSGVFAPRSVAKLEGTVRRLAVEFLERMRHSDDPDFVRDFTSPLPAHVVADLMGVPREDWPRFKEWSDAITRLDPGKMSDPTPEDLAPAMELAAYVGELIERRRREPGDDMMSFLLAARAGERPLTEAEILAFGFLLMIAGHETSTNLVGNAVVLLHEHPDERDKLVADPSLIPRAVEEFLRYEGPVQSIARTTAEEITLHGVTIPPDTRVLLLFGAANRDEREFEDPDRFDVTRQARQHLSFGYGAHFCLGAGLARLTARVACEELLARYPRYRLLGDHVERVPAGLVRGPASLPIDLHAA